MTHAEIIDGIQHACWEHLERILDEVHGHGGFCGPQQIDDMKDLVSVLHKSNMLK